MKKLFTFVLALAAVTAGAQTLKEYKLYTTNFQDWEAASSSTTEKTKTVTTRGSNETLTISWAETQIAPEGTNAKFTADVITSGYAMSAKTATPYIRTTALKNVTKVEYVHAATGGSRGWGLRVKEAGETEWTVLQKEYCAQAGTKVTVDVNKENVALEWYNLNGSQNAYMTEFTIYGMAEDDGKAAEYTISYFDQNGEKLGDKIQTEDETLVFAYGESDLTIEEGQKFRGWFTADGVKMRGGEPIAGDLRLKAVVTPIEVAAPTALYEYDLTKSTFYAEDHECFQNTGGSRYDDGKHGWVFQSSDKLGLPVAGKAYIRLNLCMYGTDADMTITTSEGKEVAAVSPRQEKDGQVVEVYYNGAATTLTLSFGAGQTYIHKVAIFNVMGEVRKSPLGWWYVHAGDGNALLLTLGRMEDGDKVFMPNGVYDFGETVLTTISKNNISIIGESMEGTIIRNAPDASKESISNTATLLVTGTNTYLQDVTIQNALDYYSVGTGRAVTIQDKGTKTICKNVRLLSYQDTYYSNKIGGLHYFEGGSIHGTVDFICGDGSTYFKEVDLYCEKRSKSGGGSDAVTASSADKTDKGYLFEGCTLLSECPTVSLGRAWNNLPQTFFLNTTVDYSAGNFSLTGGGIQRWTNELMNKGAFPKFGEYNTRDTEGTLLTPESNVVTFIDTKDNNKTQNIETVLTAAEAAELSYEKFFGTAWDPAAEARQAGLSVTLEGDMVKWNEAAGGAYLIYVDGKLVSITDQTSYSLSSLGATAEQVAVRAANARGGFGPLTKVGETTAVQNVPFDGAAESGVKKVMVDGKVVILLPDGRGYNLVGELVNW